MHRSRAASLGLLALILVLTDLLGACAGGLMGGAEKKRAYFDALERDTLARLIKEQPQTKQELAESVGFLVAEQDIVKIPTVGWGSGVGVAVEKANAKRTYLRIPQLQFGMGWGGRVEKVVMIFQDRDKLRDLADGKWHAGIGAEAAAKVSNVGIAGSGTSSDLLRNGYSAYVPTDTGISGTATIGVIRAQPYSIE
ncbi:MAG TPA: hypothetical protein VF078_07715 [Nitrospira sp.]